jgi:signal transduction histidine kinase/ligand-binding sensor domain-containing protein
MKEMKVFFHNFSCLQVVILIGLISYLTLIIKASVSNGFYDDSYPYILTNWNNEKGLPQNTVTSILQTKDGYIWIATLGGLARFDGINFTNYNSNIVPVLKENRFFRLFQDFEDILWINTEYKDIYFYKNDKFTALEIEGKERGFFFITRDADGAIWVRNDNSIIKVSFTEDGKTGTVLEKIDLSEITNTDEVYDVIIQDKEIWVSIEGKKLFCLSRATSKVLNIVDTNGTAKLFQFKSNKTDNKFWVVTIKSIGLFVNGKIQPKCVVKNSRIFLATNTYIDEKNNLWFIDGEKLIKVSESEVEISQIGNLPDKSRSLTFDNVGGIWIGTSGYGLYHAKKKRVKVFGRLINKKLIEARSVFEDSNENLFIGSFGAFGFNKNGSLTHQWESPQDVIVTSINQDKNGKIWFATDYKIYQFNGSEAKSFSNITSLFDDKKATVAALFFDNQNNLWMGGKTGILKISKDGQKQIFTTKDGLVNDWTIRITQTRNGDMWFGTLGGLSILRDGKFTNYTIENGLSNNSVRAIYEDADGTVWIGSYGGGISRFRDGKIEHVNTKHGLAEDIVSSILPDENDNFWTLGNNGISVVNRKMLNDFLDGKIDRITTATYGVVDGMTVSEGNGVNQYCAWKAKDGTLWFAMVNGVVQINPNSLSKMPPQVYIEKVMVGDKSADKNNLNLEYFQNNIEIGFTGLHFGKPENIQFRYKLENFNDDWTYSGMKRTAYYTYLPPGNYIFQVQALSSDGIWSNETASVPIVINAPFWRKGWFYLIIATALLGIIVLGFVWRLRHIEMERLRQKRFSEELILAFEAERKRIASDLHDGIGQNLLVIRNWATLALKNLNKNHETTKTQLMDILDFSAQTVQDTRDIASDLMPLHLQRFGLTNTVENMLKRFQKSSGVETIIDLDNIDGILSEEKELAIYRIVQECVNNMIKHSEARKAYFSIKVSTDNFIHIEIMDNGKGFDSTEKNQFQPKTVGFGLYSITERVKLMNGTIKIISGIGQGTKISVKVKIDATHLNKNWISR